MTEVRRMASEAAISTLRPRARRTGGNQSIVNRDAIPDGGDVVPAGTRLRIRISSREKGLKLASPPNDTSVEEKSGPRPPAGGAETGGLLHTVRKDENLQRIARKYFPDDREGWRVLYDANQDALPSPDRIRVGQVLRIPSHPR